MKTLVLVVIAVLFFASIAFAGTTIGKMAWCREHDSGIRYCQYPSKVFCTTYIKQMNNPKEWACVRRK